MLFPHDAMDNATQFGFSGSSETAGFSFDCAFYRRTKRELLANGWDAAQIFGKNEIDVDTILLGFMDPQDGQSVPTWSARTVNKILSEAPLSLRLASTFLLTKMMRVRSTIDSLYKFSADFSPSGLFGLASRI